MGLKEEAEETRRLLAEALEREEKEAETDPVETEKEVEKVEEKVEELEKKVEDKPPEPTEEEKKAHNAEFARLRRETAENKRLLEELQAKKPEPVVEQPKQGNPHDKETNYEAWLEYELGEARAKADQVAQWVEERQTTERQQQLMREATQELGQHISAYKAKVDDFDDAIQYGQAELRKAYKIAGLSPKQIDDALDKKVLTIAAMAARDGIDPAEALYNYTKELGYVKKAKEDTEEETDEDLKPDQGKLAENRSRNAGMAAARGSKGGADVTRRMAATQMTNAQFARLSASEKERLMRG